VTFAVVFGGTIKDPWGNMKAGFKATTAINRFEYGLKWNALPEAGGATVGKEVDITLNLEFTQNKAS
jgi:polyisoprenoid-binding protein YceI